MFVPDAWTHDPLGDIEREIGRGNPMGQRQITLARLALMNATDAGVAICNFAFRASGGTGLRAGDPQRCVRDMQAGAQHLLVWPLILRDCGRELLGRADGRVWATMGLAKL